MLFERVVELCKEKGISQRKLQEEMGMSIGALSKWKTSMPNAVLLQNTADYFNVTTDYLTGRTKYRNKDHMLQCFDQNYKPDVNNTKIPYDYCVQTDEGIVMIEAMTAAPKYIEPETRELAEQIMNDEQLKYIMRYLAHTSKTKVDAIYNMVKAMDNE